MYADIGDVDGRRGEDVVMIGLARRWWVDISEWRGVIGGRNVEVGRGDDWTRGDGAGCESRPGCGRESGHCEKFRNSLLVGVEYES